MIYSHDVRLSYTVILFMLDYVFKMTARMNDSLAKQVMWPASVFKDVHPYFFTPTLLSIYLFLSPALLIISFFLATH